MSAAQKKQPMYGTLDEVPWNSVTAVIGPSGNAVGIDPDGFAVWFNGPRTGQRIPLDAGGPWAPADAICRRHKRKLYIESDKPNSPPLKFHVDDNTACLPL